MIFTTFKIVFARAKVHHLENERENFTNYPTSHLSLSSSRWTLRCPLLPSSSAMALAGPLLFGSAPSPARTTTTGAYGNSTTSQMNGPQCTGTPRSLSHTAQLPCADSAHQDSAQVYAHSPHLEVEPAALGLATPWPCTLQLLTRARGVVGPQSLRRRRAALSR